MVAVVLGVGELTAPQPEAIGVERMQVERAEMDAGADAVLAERRLQGIARPAALGLVDDDRVEVAGVRPAVGDGGRTPQRQVREA